MFDDYDDPYADCGNTGCGRCDVCIELIERDLNIDPNIDGDYDDWEGTLTTRIKYPFI